ncbi:MAG: hypothetical protein ACREBP_06020 [Sphingomicrobium sp.]
MSAVAIALLAVPANAALQSQKKGAGKPNAQIFCIRFDDTGTHINREECRTKKEWAQRGVDIDEVLKK